jgi:hypothetical protein
MRENYGKHASIGAAIALAFAVLGAPLVLSLHPVVAAAALFVLALLGLAMSAGSGRISALGVYSLVLALLSGSCLVISAMWAVGAVLRAVFGPLLGGLLMVAAIVLLAVLAVVLDPQGRRRRLDAEGRCGRCGYDVRASPLRCPECGEPVAEDQIRRRRILMGQSAPSPAVRARLIAATGPAGTGPPLEELVPPSMRSATGDAEPALPQDPAIALPELRRPAPPPDLSPLPLAGDDEPGPSSASPRP